MPAFTGISLEDRQKPELIKHEWQLKLDVGHGDCRGHVSGFQLMAVDDPPVPPFQFALVSPAFAKGPGVLPFVLPPPLPLGRLATYTRNGFGLCYGTYGTHCTHR